MLIGRFFINQDTWWMEPACLEFLREKMVEEVANDPEGLTIGY